MAFLVAGIVSFDLPSISCGPTCRTLVTTRRFYAVVGQATFGLPSAWPTASTRQLPSARPSPISDYKRPLVNASQVRSARFCMRRSNSRFYSACYTSRDGRQLKRSTKTTDRNQATEIVIEFERVERRAMQGALTATQNKKVFIDDCEKVTGDTLVAPATQEYLHALSAGVQKEISARVQKETVLEGVISEDFRPDVERR